MLCTMCAVLIPCIQDPCWYYAQKTDRPEKKGAIPITHVRLVYMSDDGRIFPTQSSVLIKVLKCDSNASNRVMSLTCWSKTLCS